MIRKAVIVSSFATALVPILFWLGGFNFNERGAIAVGCLVMCLFVFMTTAACAVAFFQDSK